MTTTTKHERHQERDAERGRGIGSHLLWVTLVLVVYVLSIGPAALLYEKTTNTPLKAALKFTYAPVVGFVIDKPLVGPVIAWWITQWIDMPALSRKPSRSGAEQ